MAKAYVRVAALLHSIGAVKQSDEMALLIHALERRKHKAEQALRDAPKPVNNNPTEPENRPLSIQLQT